MGNFVASVSVALSLFIVAGSCGVEAQVQEKLQQKCITKLNKRGSKLAAAQGKTAFKCVNFAGKGKLEKLAAVSAQSCLAADLKGKLAKAEAKLAEDADKFCTAPEAIPDFGVPTGSAALDISSEIRGQMNGIVADLFGPVLDGAAIDCDDDKSGCKCQAKVLKDANKLASARLKEFLKCKKAALAASKDPFPSGADSASDLEDCVDEATAPGSIAADSKGKIAKKVAKLALDIDTKCSPADVVSDEPFPGRCIGLAGAALPTCIEQRGACRVCLLINALDGLDVDCDDFDDGLDNDTCAPEPYFSQETVDIGSAAQPAETPGSAGVIVTNPNLTTILGPSPDLNRARYTRHYWSDEPTPDAILILVPGFEGGAGDFLILAENLLATARARSGQNVEVWAFDRRTAQLEDTEGLDIAEATLDPLIATDWLFGAEMGLSLHPALAAGPNRRAIFHNTQDDVPFIANWTSLVFSQDIDAVVEEALSATPNVFLGGHSAGTGYTARYAATDFDLTGLGPAEPGYAKLRGLVLLEGGGGSTGSAPSADTLDRIEAKFDGGLFAAVRDNAARCSDGSTPCTIANEAVDCSGIGTEKCTNPAFAYSIIPGLLTPQILAAVEPAAIQGATDPDEGQIILQVDFGGGTAVATVPALATLGALPQGTVFGGIGTFIDDDGPISGLASFVATSVGVSGATVDGLLTWQDITEVPMPGVALPDNGAPPTSLPAGKWGQEVEATDFNRALRTFYQGGTNFTDWYYPSSGLGVTSVSGVCDTGGSGLCTVGNVGAACSSNGECSQSLGLDSTALSVGRGRRDIENLTEAANIDIPVIGFGGSNGLVPVPGSFVAFAQSIGACDEVSFPSCDGSTGRVVDAALPNPAFPTLGDTAGGFEVHISEGYSHVDVLTAEGGPTNQVIEPLVEFLARNSQ